MSMNYYPPCPQPELTSGLPMHSDCSLITILLQYDLPGHQVLKNGKWMAVNPIPSTFAVNIGDQMQVNFDVDSHTHTHTYIYILKTIIYPMSLQCTAAERSEPIYLNFWFPYFSYKKSRFSEEGLGMMRSHPFPFCLIIFCK